MCDLVNYEYFCDVTHELGSKSYNNTAIEYIWKER